MQYRVFYAYCAIYVCFFKCFPFFVGRDYCRSTLIRDPLCIKLLINFCNDYLIYIALVMITKYLLMSVLMFYLQFNILRNQTLTLHQPYCNYISFSFSSTLLCDFSDILLYLSFEIWQRRCSRFFQVCRNLPNKVESFAATSLMITI